MNEDFLIVRMPEGLKSLLKQRAKSEKRNMTGQVLHLIEKDLQENGLITVSAPTQPTAPQAQS